MLSERKLIVHFPYHFYFCYYHSYCSPKNHFKTLYAKHTLHTFSIFINNSKIQYIIIIKIYKHHFGNSCLVTHELHNFMKYIVEYKLTNNEFKISTIPFILSYRKQNGIFLLSRHFFGIFMILFTSNDY